MSSDTDDSAEKCLLKGTLTLKAGHSNSDKGVLIGSTLAFLNLTIRKHTFSGCRIDRVGVNLKGNTSVSNFKDDVNVTKTIQSVSHVKNLQYVF